LCSTSSFGIGFTCAGLTGALARRAALDNLDKRNKDPMTFPVDIFAATMPEAKTHPQFRALRDSQFHGEARSLMNELYTRMGDPNGNFIYDFQGDGFHSRVFELACFAYLESAGFSLDRSNEKPDFLAHRGEFTLAIEATTANPSTGRHTDISVLQMPELSEEQIADKVINDFPRRMSSILNRKLKHKYHQLPQCTGKPLVLMIAPFFEAGSVFYTDEGLVECLYGPANAACLGFSVQGPRYSGVAHQPTPAKRR
jgi:hypothetical protein